MPALSRLLRAYDEWLSLENGHGTRSYAKEKWSMPFVGWADPASFCSGTLPSVLLPSSKRTTWTGLLCTASVDFHGAMAFTSAVVLRSIWACPAWEPCLLPLDLIFLENAPGDFKQRSPCFTALLPVQNAVDTPCHFFLIHSYLDPAVGSMCKRQLL